MRCLVVWAHPMENSLCGRLAGTVVRTLERGGHEVQVEDLYRGGFEACLTERERSSYYMERFEGAAINSEIERLVWAEGLVLVFPTWWFGFPALLKGWFDRVWAPGVAYDHASDFGPIQARLRGLRKCLAITTLGAPWWVDSFVLRNPVKRVLKIALLGTCAPGCSFEMLSLYKAERVPLEAVERFEARIGNKLSRW